jgi:hypothetical protein
VTIFFVVTPKFEDGIGKYLSGSFLSVGFFFVYSLALERFTGKPNSKNHDKGL